MLNYWVKVSSYCRGVNRGSAIVEERTEFYLGNRGEGFLMEYFFALLVQFYIRPICYLSIRNSRNHSTVDVLPFPQ